MTVGMTVWLDDGAVQIDSDIRVSTIAYQTTFSGPYTILDTPFVGTMPYYFDIVIPTSVKSLFFSSTTAVTLALWAKTGTTWRFRASAQATIKIFGFADQTITPSSSGLQMYNALGVLTFDSDSQFMRIVDVVRGAASGTSKSWPSTSRSYAAGIGSYPRRGMGAAQAGIPYWVLMAYGVSVGPSTYGVGEVPVASRPTGGGGVPPPPNSPTMQPPTLMVVDVTGF